MPVDRLVPVGAVAVGVIVAAVAGMPVVVPVTVGVTVVMPVVVGLTAGVVASVAVPWAIGMPIPAPGAVRMRLALHRCLANPVTGRRLGLTTPPPGLLVPVGHQPSSARSTSRPCSSRTSHRG